ncbi:MAG: hypothetical protein E7H32_03735 [Anaerococcus sp.]|uniref:hypothetical protein n=1 Tax=Anaerococcus sp. TaxID=1872515 RepID=UPI00291566A9|nr:hypothetical protein [Anaerococcus sp.]MDU4025779.1 hypothetical protein [Anaerococcus sp.]
MKKVNANRNYMTFLNGLTYVYIPIFIFLIAGTLIRNYNVVFIFSFFIIITISYFSAYYIVNKNYSKIHTNKFIESVIPLIFIISAILSILVSLFIEI